MDNIQQIRKEIDQIDQKILELLGKRLEKIKKIKSIKNSQNLQTEDLNRESHILSKTNNPFSLEIFKKIIEESKKIQEEL